MAHVSATRVFTLGSLREADDQRPEHASVAVVRQDMLSLVRLIDVLLGLRKVAETQVNVPKIGVE